jgi:hypothetical protein
MRYLQQNLIFTIRTFIYACEDHNDRRFILISYPAYARPFIYPRRKSTYLGTNGRLRSSDRLSTLHPQGTIKFSIAHLPKPQLNWRQLTLLKTLSDFQVFQILHLYGRMVPSFGCDSNHTTRPFIQCS